MDRRLGLPREKGTYICDDDPEIVQNMAHDPPFSYTVVIRDPTKGWNEGGRGAVGEPGLFFLLRRDALSLTYAAARATPCVRA